MKNILPIWFLFIFGQSFAQQKGATPLPPSSSNSQGTVRAVVIGISDYQNEEIPDLQYADKDAIMFANWLSSTKGSEINSNNLKVLTNEEATMGKIMAALDWLIDETKRGDVAIIYFSGHGDVEKRFVNDPGYLLVWDSPPNSYMLNAFPVNFLNNVISALSVNNEANVLFISDACRSGKLAGSDINGSRITNANLSKQFANELKILSCQQDEYSFEGEQWGGGHGAFTYHLVEGLYGLADNNSNLEITLSEIDRYLEDNVSTQVQPEQQTPVTVGNKTELITYINEKAFAEHINKKAEEFEIQNFSPVGGRGWESNILANIDTVIARKYELFKIALADNMFFEPTGTCADDLYNELTALTELQPLHNQMKRNYAAALQDDAQQSLNRLIIKPELEMDIWYSPALVDKYYGPQPKKLERAAELLGPDHYMYPILQARKELFKGAVQQLQCSVWKNIPSGTKAMEHFKASLKWQPRAPHTYLWIGRTYFFNFGNLDSTDHYHQLAIENAPSWQLPKYILVKLHSEAQRFPEAKVLLDDLMLDADTTDGNLWSSWSYYYAFQGKFSESAFFDNKAIKYSPESIFYKAESLIALGFLSKKDLAIKRFNDLVKLDYSSGFSYYYMGNMYFLKQEYQNAIPYFKQAIVNDPSMIWSYSHLGDTYIYLDSIDQAEVVLKQGYKRDSLYMPLINSMGGLYAGKKDHERAKYFFEKAIELDPSPWPPHYNLILTYTAIQDYDKAIDNLRLAFEKGMKNELRRYYGKGYEFFGDDPELEPIKQMEGYKELMRKYFPEEYKD